MGRDSVRVIEFVDDDDVDGDAEGFAAPSNLPDSGAVQVRPNRRRRRYLVAAGVAIAVLGGVGVSVWQNHQDGALLHRQPGVVDDLSKPPVVAAVEQVDAASPLVWLGTEVMVSRGGALVGLDPASGVQRWSVPVAGNLFCAGDMGYGRAGLVRQEEVSCVGGDGERLVTVAAGGQVVGDVALVAPDAWAVTQGGLVRASWVTESTVLVEQVDTAGEQVWSVRVAPQALSSGMDSPEGPAITACTTWEPDATGELVEVEDDRALWVATVGAVTLVEGCGVSASIDRNGEVVAHDDSSVRNMWGSDPGTAVWQRPDGSLETQILGPDGSVDRTLDGQVLVPSCGDGQTQGWLVARSEGLVRLDGDGRQLWSVGEYPDAVLAALAQVAVVSAGDGVWSVDPETGERGWQWDLAEVTTGWDAARGGASPPLEWYGPWSAFTDGQVVMLVVSGDMPVAESDAELGSITVESRSGLVGLDAATGKVMWEVAPDDVDRMFVAVDGHLLGVRTPRWTEAESSARGEVAFFG